MTIPAEQENQPVAKWKKFNTKMKQKRSIDDIKVNAVLKKFYQDEE